MYYGPQEVPRFHSGAVGNSKLTSDISNHNVHSKRREPNMPRHNPEDEVLNF